MRLMTRLPIWETRDRLVMEHVGLVRGVAGRLAHRVPSQVEVLQLISVGVLGPTDAPAASSRHSACRSTRFRLPSHLHGRCRDALRDLTGAALGAQDGSK